MDEFDRDMRTYEEAIKERALESLKDDVAYGDITTDSLFDSDFDGSAVIIAKTPCVLAGLLEAKTIFDDGGIAITKSMKEGSQVKAGDKVMRLHGPVKEILKRERTALNYIQRMSAIATKSGELSKKWGKRVSFLRKCDPGLLYSEKRAVMIGGCMTHRINLSDGYLIKDNHLVFLENVKEAIGKISKKARGFVEIEVSDFDVAVAAAKTFKKLGLKGGILLDNMGIKEVKKAVNGIRKINGHIIIEASGGIDEKNIGDYLKTGVDFVSTSILVTNAPKVDMSLELAPRK